MNKIFKLLLMSIFLNSITFSYYVINETYFYINGTKFSFFGWLWPYTPEGTDLGLIKFKALNSSISLSPWFDCNSDYNQCAASYIKYFYLPYLYWQKILRTDNTQTNFNFEYSGILNQKNHLQFHFNDFDTGVNVIFSKIPDEVYYLNNNTKVYFSFLPDEILINSEDNLTNTQYEFKDNPSFLMKVNGKKVKYSLLSYPNFYLFRGNPGSSTFYPVKEDVRNKKIFKSSQNTALSYNSSSRGKIDLDFSLLLKANNTNRFLAIEYQPIVYWKCKKGNQIISGSSESKLKSYYSFVKGPNTVIYLRKIKVG